MSITEEKDKNILMPKAIILIVDDDPVNLTIAEGLLKPMGMNIFTATGAADALNVTDAVRADLILMDYMMPETNGVEALKLIRKAHPEYDDIPVIALTATIDADIKEMFLSAGMNDILPKPIERKMLISKVSGWLLISKMRRAIEELDTDAMEEAAHMISRMDLPDAQAELAGMLCEAVDDIDAERCEGILDRWETLLTGD